MSGLGDIFESKVADSKAEHEAEQARRAIQEQHSRQRYAIERALRPVRVKRAFSAYWKAGGELLEVVAGITRGRKADDRGWYPPQSDYPFSITVSKHLVHDYPQYSWLGSKTKTTKMIVVPRLSFESDRRSVDPNGPICDVYDSYHGLIASEKIGLGQKVMVLDLAEPHKVLLGELVSEPQRGGTIVRRIKSKTYAAQDVPAQLRLMLRGLVEEGIDKLVGAALSRTPYYSRKPLDTGDIKAVLQQVDEAINSYQLTGTAPPCFREALKAAIIRDHGRDGYLSHDL